MGYWPAAAEDVVERQLAHARVRVYPGQAETVVEALARSVAAGPGAPAVSEVGGRSLTFGQLWEETEALAGGLQERFEVGAGERVALLMANGIDFIVSFVAAMRAGAVAVPLNTKYMGPELEKLLAASGAKVLLAEREWWPKVEPALERTQVRHSALAGELGALRGRFAPPALGAEDPAVLMYTSGTTGLSKGALQSHLNLVANAETWVRCLGLEPGDRTVVAAPLFHATGWHGQLFPLLTVGGSGAILPRFDADRLAGLFAEGAATFFHASPTIYVMTLQAAKGRRAKDLRTCVSGGSFVSRRLVAETRAFAPGVDFRISYGMTETSSPAVLTPAGFIDSRPGNAVGVPVPVDDLRIDSRDGGPGEVLFRGATVIAGYDENPEANASSFTDGWLRSGDLGSMDADGFVTVLDRIKDMINRGAEKIWSLQVENVLCEHPAVREAAVLAKPDPVYGEVPRAVVALHEGREASAEELQAFARERLAKFEVPVEVDFVAELPRNPAGKLLKSLLR